jgi:hypothetical protein
LTASERLAFLTGAIDCYVFDVHGTEYSDESLESYVQAITTYYLHHPEASKLSVPDVMRKVPRQGAKPQAAVGRSDDLNDGEFWRQTPGREKLVFVEGYLACRARYLRSNTGMPVALIASEISKWYGVSDEDASQADAHRSADKVGDVIDRIVVVREKPQR